MNSKDQDDEVRNDDRTNENTDTEVNVSEKKDENENGRIDEGKVVLEQIDIIYQFSKITSKAAVEVAKTVVAFILLFMALYATCDVFVHSNESVGVTLKRYYTGITGTETHISDSTIAKIAKKVRSELLISGDSTVVDSVYIKIITEKPNANTSQQR